MFKKKVYQVWALGYDVNNSYLGFECFIKEFKNPKEAINFCKSVTLDDIKFDISSEVTDICFQVETVVSYKDYQSNIDTKFEKWIEVR